MNKILKSVLALLIILSFSSCVMEIANPKKTTNDNESFEFNFRTIQELVDTELKVTLYSGDTVIDSKTRTLKKADENIKFVFDNLLIGNTYTIKTSITKDGTELYKSTDTKTIELGNNQVDVNLKQAQKSIRIAPPKSIDLEQYRGNYFKVNINGEPKEIKLGELPVESPEAPMPDIQPIKDIFIDLGKLPVDKPISIKAEISNPVTGSFYTFNDTITITEDTPNDYNLPDMTKNKGTLLFGNDGGRTYVGFNYNSEITAPQRDEDIQSGYAPIDYGDLAITDNGDLWSLTSSGNPTLEYIPHGNNFMKYQNYDLTTAIENINQVDSIVTWSGITAYKDGILMLGDQNRNKNFYYLSQKSNDPTTLVSKKFTTTLPQETIDAQICNIAVSNDVIYASFFTGRKLTIYKGSINEQAGTVILDKPVFDTTTYFDSSSIQPENRPFKLFNFVTTDLVVVDGNLYALLLDITDNYPVSDNSRGALVKIEQDGKKITCKGLHETSRADTHDRSEYNVYMLNNPSDADKYFLGPRKFIAIKPDELVIADSGAISTDDYKKPNLLKKIKTVNLNDLTIKSSDIDGNIFEGQVLSAESSDFGYSVK